MDHQAAPFEADAHRPDETQVAVRHRMGTGARARVVVVARDLQARVGLHRDPRYFHSERQLKQVNPLNAPIRNEPTGPL